MLQLTPLSATIELGFLASKRPGAGRPPLFESRPIYGPLYSFLRTTTYPTTPIRQYTIEGSLLYNL